MRRAVFLLLLVPAARARADGEVRLLTDDAIPRYLARGQELAKAEQWDKVVDVLHRIVIGDPEVFPEVKDEVLQSAVYSTDGRTFHPARELCLLELARLPPEGLRAYRDVHDVTARQLLEAADATPEIEDRILAYAKVHENYLPSSVGDDALERAAELSLSLGRYYEALALYRRLIDVYPKDTDRDLPLAFAKAAYCAARIGDAEQLAGILDRLGSEYAGATVRVEGKAVPAAELKDLPLFRRGGGDAHADSDWPMAGGNASRSRNGTDLPEDLPRRPFWSFNLAERDSRLTAQGSIWRVFVHDREQTPKPQLGVSAREQVAPYPTLFPVVHDGLLLYKDGREIVARRPASGTLVHLVGWPHAPPSPDDPLFKSPLKEVRPGTEDAGREAAVIEAVYESLDYGAADLYATDDRIVALDWRTPPHDLRTDAPVASTPNSLCGYSRSTGKLIWAWDEFLYSLATKQDQALFEAWQRDFQIHRSTSFFGAGVCAGGLAYTLASGREAEEPGMVSLWAFDLGTGRVRFRTALHYDDEVTAQLPRGAALATAGGTVYAVTQAGVVAAVDALPPGRVRWITRYERSYEGPQARSGRVGRVKQTFAFNVPIVAEGKVLIAPADAAEVLALDAETGRVIWSIPKRALLLTSCVLGARDGLLFLSGEKVLAIDLAKGEVVWSKTLDTTPPFGRGFVGERYVYVPTYEGGARSHVQRFELRTGNKADPLVFDVARLGNLLSLEGRLIVSNGTEIMCFTSYETEIARIDAAVARGDARKAELLLERALLALGGGTKRRDQAREDFRRALEAAPGAAQAGIRRHALDNLFAIAWERNDLGALDEAETLVAPLREQAQPGADPPAHPYDAQIALLRAEVLGRLGKGQESFEALLRFLDRFGQMRVLRGGRVVDGTAAAASLREQLQSESPAFAAAFAETVRGKIEDAVARKDAAALKAILARYGEEPPAEEARFALADLYEAQNDLPAAEAELKDFVDNRRQHPRLAVAYLRLARIHARQGKTEAARRARFEAVSRLDEAARRENRALVMEVDAHLAAAQPPEKAPPLRLPLAAAPIALEGAAAVPVEGGLPDGLALFASAAEYLAVDPKGTVRWRAANPSRTGVPAGPDGEPFTAAAAGAIAAARFAVRRGEDVLLGDVAGLMRVHAAGGEVRWRYPGNDAVARDEANVAIDLLREDLRLVRTTGFATRSHPLPSYLLSEGAVICVHPKRGVEVINAESGEIVWVGPDTQGQVAVGPPSTFGGLFVVGFAKPGWLRVYQVAQSAPVHTWQPAGATLLAPPLVDPLGRLFVVSSNEKDGANGQLEVFDIRSGEAKIRYPVATASAAVLHADGRLLVYHDGSSGAVNLHCIDLETGKDLASRAPDLLRSYHVVADPQWVFVLTSSPGLEDEGGRLFRINPTAGEVLDYDYAVRAAAFARPVLTEHHIAVAALLARGAEVRLFDREASPQSRGPQPLFVDPAGKETAAMDLRATGTTRFGAGIGVAAADGGLVAGHPWGAVRLVQPGKEGR